MPPMTKIWLCTLKDTRSISTPEFQELITELLNFCGSYTNPYKDPALPPMHAFFQDTQDPAKLFMITGYPSQEMNTEADNIYAERYLPRMFGFVQHKALWQVNLDVRALPLCGEVAVAVGKNPGELKNESAVGAWDYWPETRGIKVDGADKLWVQVQEWDGSSGVSLSPVDGELLLGKKIGSS
ncbi:hypothetical protein N7478_001848 [Penicillium angulare]|uniref:uncharacterized protein n=1 Tax=Penicillium angulare TaxID=116970 RepID=UPI0025425FF1|nr:uncharacterized protein N7478_001848 [Penicillium angulare]KAJ5288818.1 hypothetical protein N7478_001848 [Penicillium angulare]